MHKHSPSVARRVIYLCCTLTVALPFWAHPVTAGDPFRTDNVRDIGEETEAAFEAIFKEGNYPQAEHHLLAAQQSEASEPLVQAMLASFAYTQKDWTSLKNYALRTQETAAELKSSDPVRGNIYLAVGYFLEGTYKFKQEDDLVGAIANLAEVFDHLEAAQKSDPNDPELNLLKGYMELMLAVNLPFSSPEQAIERLQLAAPTYLVNRGIAVAYRDLKDYNQAREFAERALQATPENPELYYLKGQILSKQGRKTDEMSLVKQALENYDIALSKIEQLPKATAKSLRRERRKAAEWIQERE